MRKEIWKNAIKCFKRCCSPFSTEELNKMDVTSTECGELSFGIANAMEFTAYIQEKHPLIFCALALHKEMPHGDIYNLINHMRTSEHMGDIQKKIKELKI